VGASPERGPSGKFVKAVGEVLYLLDNQNSQPHVGLRFEEPSETSRDAIREYVDDASV
jgi:hypothetical protein